jgi:hypothetical protein
MARRIERGWASREQGACRAGRRNVPAGLSEVPMKLAFILFSATLAGSWTLPATAQQLPCGNRDDMVKSLSSQYREQPRALGLASQTAIIEVFTSNTGSWTILLTRPDGASCILSAGEAWQDIPPTENYTAL